MLYFADTLVIQGAPFVYHVGSPEEWIIGTIIGITVYLSGETAKSVIQYLWYRRK